MSEIPKNENFEEAKTKVGKVSSHRFMHEKAFKEIKRCNQRLDDICRLNTVLNVGLLEDSVYSKRGISYLSLGNVKEAYKDFKKSLELKPHEIIHKLNFGLVSWMYGDYKNGEKLLKDVIKLDNSLIHVHVSIGLMYYIIGDLYRAIKNCKIAYNINPKESNISWCYVYGVYKYIVDKRIWDEKENENFLDLKIKMMENENFIKMGLNYVRKKTQFFDLILICND